MSVKVEVTEGDIKNGIQGEPQYCAVARAVKRVVRRKDVQVMDEGIFIKKDKYELPLTNTIESFIRKFDNYETVKPFSFVLRGYERKA